MTIVQCPGCHANVEAVVLRGGRRMCYACQPVVSSAQRQARYRERKRIEKKQQLVCVPRVQCAQCQVEKPETEFYKRNRAAKAAGRRCKQCVLATRNASPDAVSLIARIKRAREELADMEAQLETLERKHKIKKVAAVAQTYIEGGMAEDEALRTANSQVDADKLAADKLMSAMKNLLW